MEQDAERELQADVGPGDREDAPFEQTATPQEQVLEEFVRPFYSPRDTLRGLPHLRRVLKKACFLAKRHPVNIDMTVLVHSAYLHGLIHQEETRIRRFLQSQQLTTQQTERILLAAREAHAALLEAVPHEQPPQTLEGMLLHDARLLEGGRTFLIASALLQGGARGQTLEEILAAIEELSLGRLRCYLPEAQRLYADKEAFTRAFLDDLIPQL